MCARLTGADADGLLVIGPSKYTDVALDVFNADGSWAERSGNGLRIAVAHARKRSPRRKRWTISCGGDVVNAEVLRSVSGTETTIATEVGDPIFDASRKDSPPASSPELKILRVGKTHVSYFEVEVGNPHAVIPLRRFPRDWKTIGEHISTHKRFAQGLNVEFARIVSPRKIEVKVFERGVGPTCSSGTGASAAVSALIATRQVSSKVTVHFPGEDTTGHTLVVTWKDTSRPIVVSGSVRRLFELQVDA